MKRAILLMTGGAIALLVGMGADAATTSGKVVVTDELANSITIQSEDGKRFVFTRNDATKIEHNGASVALGQIPKDSRVTVTTDQAPSDPLMPMLASRVEVEEMAVAASTSGSAPSTVQVGSAGKAGEQPIHTAQVESADTERSPKRLPKTATPLPLLTVCGAGSLASGLALRLRRRR
jgi:hypothetical protein